MRELVDVAPPRPHHVAASRVAIVAVGAGLAVIVGHDGTPAWQALRLVAVVLVARAALRRSTVAAALLAGAAVPVGAGIGLPHLAKDPASMSAVAGSVVLLGGLVLVGRGVARVWRASGRAARWPAALGAVLAVLVLCWTLGQAVAATNVPRPAVGSRTPADAGLAYRDVEFEATDGVRLSGWYLPSANGAAVILLHGAGSTRSNVLDHAGVLARHGYGVLLFDARGHGRSDGRAMDFGWFGDRDIGGALAFLQLQRDVDPGRIGAVGLSMGGEQAIGAAADFPAIRAVVAEGATNRVAGDRAWLSEEYGARGAVSELVAAMTTGFTDILTSARPPASLHDAVGDAAVPTLLIAAGKVADEAHAARYIRSAAPAVVEIWVVPDAGHTDGLRTQPEVWEERTTTFLARALGVADALRG